MNNIAEQTQDANGLIAGSTQLPQFTADPQTVQELVTKLRSGETTIDELCGEAYKKLSDITSEQLSKSRGHDSDTVLKLISDLKKATDDTRPEKFQRKPSRLVSYFTKTAQEVKLDVEKFLAQYESYQKGFADIENSLNKRVTALGDDLETQRKTVQAIMEGGNNLVTLKAAMEELAKSGDLGAVATMGSMTADSDNTMLQKQITNINGTIALFATSLVK